MGRMGCQRQALLLLGLGLSHGLAFTQLPPAFGKDSRSSERGLRPAPAAARAQAKSSSTSVLRDSRRTTRGERRVCLGSTAEGAVSTSGSTLAALQVSGGGVAAPETKGSSSLMTSIFNLAKNIIGGGMLALPAGMAAGAGTGWVPAISLMMLTCASSAYTFYSLGASTEDTGARNFKELWARTIGEKSSWCVDAAICLLCFGVCIMYGCFLGDIFSSLAGSFGGGFLPAWACTRGGAIVGITSLVLLPLCLLRDLSALSFSSILGILAVLYVTAFTGLRFFDGSYGAGGQFMEFVGQAQPAASSVNSLLGISVGTCVLFNMGATAFMAHPNAVKFYNDLKDTSPKRFRGVCAAAFMTAATVVIAAMGFGFATFGSSSSGLILNNYHPTKDKLATFARAATGISIIGSQPLLFTGLRDSAFSTLNAMGLVGKDVDKRTVLWAALSTAILTAATGLAILTPDVGLVVSLIGSLLGAGMTYSLPGIIRLKCLRKKATTPAGERLKGLEPMVLRLLVVFGGAMTVVGTVITILEKFTNVLK